jgi:hypothetical protein
MTRWPALLNDFVVDEPTHAARLWERPYPSVLMNLSASIASFCLILEDDHLTGLSPRSGAKVRTIVAPACHACLTMTSPADQLFAFHLGEIHRLFAEIARLLQSIAPRGTLMPAFRNIWRKMHHGVTME